MALADKQFMDMLHYGKDLLFGGPDGQSFWSSFIKNTFYDNTLLTLMGWSGIEISAKGTVNLYKSATYNALDLKK